MSSSAAPLAEILVGADAGDFIAGIRAIIATVALVHAAAWANAAVCVFNVWDATDLLFGLGGSGLAASRSAGGTTF